MRTIFGSFSLLLPFLDLFSALCGNGMLESMLEPHLKYAGASTVDVGVSFLVFGCCYMLGNVLFGGVISPDFNLSENSLLFFRPLINMEILFCGRCLEIIYF